MDLKSHLRPSEQAPVRRHAPGFLSRLVAMPRTGAMGPGLRRTNPPVTDPKGQRGDEPRLTRQVRVLVVEDDPVTLRAYQRILINKGAAVAGALSSGEALYVASSFPADERPNLVFLDVLLPGIDGSRLIGLLRALPGFERTPIVLVSSLNAELLTEKAERWEANGFVLKATGLVHLEAAFEKWLRLVGGPPVPPC